MDGSAQPTATTLPDFGTYFVTNLLADISADIYPDAQAVLQIIIQNGAIALLDPANSLTINSFLLKLQADAMRLGNDLSKQIATYISMALQAKFSLKKLRA